MRFKQSTVNYFTGKTFNGRMRDESRYGSPLVQLRESVGLTQEALAAALGVTDHTVRNWEKGRAEPKLSIKQMKALCLALQCTLEDLPDSFAPQSKNAEA